MYTGQFVYCGKKANLMVGNFLPLRSVPRGAVVCNVEHHLGDRGVFARASGDYAIVISHNPDNGTTRIKLPSGAKKIVPSSDCWTKDNDYWAEVMRILDNGYWAEIKRQLGNDS